MAIEKFRDWVLKGQILVQTEIGFRGKIYINQRFEVNGARASVYVGQISSETSVALAGVFALIPDSSLLYVLVELPDGQHIAIEGNVSERDTAENFAAAINRVAKSSDQVEDEGTSQSPETLQPPPHANSRNFCSQCGNKVTEPASFCSSCGSKL
jgi:hypothetical protein